MQHVFALDESLDATALAQTFARTGRVRIAPFLINDQAESLRDELKTRGDWTQVVSGVNGPVELSRATRANVSAERLAALDEAVRAEARYGFRYRYETVRVPDSAAERCRHRDTFVAFARFLSSRTVIEFLRRVTGSDEIAFADAQATAYGPGDFLTAHTDAVAGKRRKAAYVLSLCPSWRPEWGGLLLFHGQEALVESWVPGMKSPDALPGAKPSLR